MAAQNGSYEFFSAFQPSKIEVNIASKLLLQRYIITFSSDSRIVKLRKF